MNTHRTFAEIHELVVDKIDNTEVRRHIATCDLCGTLALSIAPDDAGERAAEAGLVAVDPATYVDKRPLASGGMGRTFTARDRRLGRDVVIKELPEPSDSLEPGFRLKLRARLAREARITAKLRHPSIVSIY